MQKAIVFSIEEFSVYDGPGIRTTVFLKGCPMRCNWCHNPEGFEPRVQVVKNLNGCERCGACKAVCPSPGACILCGRCISACPKNLIRFSGKEYMAEELASKLLKNADYLKKCGGGVTFSGGECLLYADFLIEIIAMLKGEKTHTAIQTCGFADERKFKAVVSAVDYVMFDLKVMDRQEAIRYTGCDNAPILKNFRNLCAGGTPFVVRVPLIPGVTDTKKNLQAIADLVKDSPALGAELLPYNKMAGSKYRLVGKKYSPIFDQTAEPNIDTEIFIKAGIPVKVL